MTLENCPDASVADWIVHSKTIWPQIVLFGPDAFDGYARLRYIPDPTTPELAESEVDGRASDIQQARDAMDVLLAFTSTPDHCFVCIWTGMPGLDSAGLESRITIGGEQYLILHGSLEDLSDWENQFPSLERIAPAFVWPADQAWCFASDIDPHWAGIGGSREAIGALVNTPRVDAVYARPNEPQPTYAE